MTSSRRSWPSSSRTRQQQRVHQRQAHLLQQGSMLKMRRARQQRQQQGRAPVVPAVHGTARRLLVCCRAHQWLQKY